jgi:hypothetical protein
VEDYFASSPGKGPEAARQRFFASSWKPESGREGGREGGGRTCLLRSEGREGGREGGKEEMKERKEGKETISPAIF